MSMRHADYLIDLVDRQGKVAGQKQRKDIDKSTDLYHGIYVLVITPDRQLVVSKIPQRTDLPNLYANRLGVTVATMRRHGETAEEAARRALADEALIVGATPDPKGNHMVDFPDGRTAYMSVFFLVHPVPQTINPINIQEIIPLSSAELKSLLNENSDSIAPTLAFICKSYNF
jgi:hypothetical protein